MSAQANLHHATEASVVTHGPGDVVSYGYAVLTIGDGERNTITVFIDTVEAAFAITSAAAQASDFLLKQELSNRAEPDPDVAHKRRLGE